MSYVVRKRPVDVFTHAIDFTGYFAETDTVASAVVLVVGEGEVTPVLTAAATVADPLVNVALAAGTALVIYQVYVTATSTAGQVKRLQFEVQVASDSEDA